ncbi:MAG: hypothetical protein PSV40_12195 [Polaromonas sp.]|uniref:hypothetical protein n=1 Tax=Polaromonas sp. TaxID=1869339 RepID=UPI002489AE6F|nr:hypothetical protein [Polaromonas sp.]MDI1269847.1 hypothetical protein [Polaromonas sp.]
MNIKNSFEKNGHIVLFCLVSAVIAFSTSLTSTVIDTFHEGEYLGFLWHMRAYYNGIGEFPLLIHGAVDYIPSIIASLIYGDERIIVGTRQIGSILLWLGWVLFLDLGHTIIPKSSRKVFWTAALVLVFVALTPKLGSDYLTMQGAIVGARDFFLVVTIWAVARYIDAASKSARFLFLWIASFAAMTSIFWCYDRGLMAVAFFGICVLGCFLTKRTVEGWFLVFSSALSLLLIEYSNIFGSITSNIDNIIYWIKYGEDLWSYPLKEQLIPYIGGGIMVLFSVVVISIAFLQKFDRGQERYLIIGLIVVQLLLLKTTMNRPGGSRTLAAIWPPILLMFHYGAALFPVSNFDWRKYLKSNTSISHYVYFASFALLFFATTNVQTLYIVGLKYGSFFKNMIMPHKDFELVSADMNQLADQLRKSNVSCFVGWTSEGVIALMANKRFCTKYTYAAYISPKEELNFLTQL